MPQKYTSANTSINSTKLPKTFSVLGKINAVKNGDIILDIGGGKFDNAIQWAETKGATLYIYDPFNRSVEFNEKSLTETDNNKSDIVTVNNVLNVIKEEEYRSSVISLALRALKQEGTAYFLIYEGDKSSQGKETQNGNSWQNNKPTKDYVMEINKYFPVVYVKYGLIIARKV